MNTPRPALPDAAAIQRQLADAMNAAALNQALYLYQSAPQTAAITIGADLSPDGKTHPDSAMYFMPDVCGRALIVIKNPRMWRRLRGWLQGMDYYEQPAHPGQPRRALALQSWTVAIAANSDGLAGFAGYWQFRSVQDAAAEAACAIFARHGVECHVITEKD